MTPWLILLGFGAGCFGALAGVGGGILITPMLAMYFGVPMHQAVAVSLVAVIATSTAASSVNMARNVADVRLGMTLVFATTFGAALAAYASAYVHRRTIALLFALFLVYSAISMVQRAWKSRSEAPQAETPEYQVRNTPAGMGASLVAGGLSGLLGIGGGPIQVPVMYLWMGVPLRVATATSNFMIGITAATSAYLYYARGDVLLAVAAPLVSGVFAGSLLGARLAPRVRGAYVLFMLIVVSAVLAAQMLYRVGTGYFG